MSAFPTILFGPESEIQDSYIETVSAGSRRFYLGQSLFTPDGRRFRFGSNGGTLAVAGTLVQSSVPVANHILQTPQAAAIGATSVVVALGATAVKANEYAEGMLHITAANSGQGYAYPIDKHGTVLASGNFTVPLVRGSVVQVAIGTTANSASLYHNPFFQVVLSATTYTSTVVGVVIEPLAASTATNVAHGWIQTRGLASVRADTSTIVVGQPVVASNAVAGDVGLPSVTIATTITQPIVGNVIAIGSSTNYALVDLHLE